MDWGEIKHNIYYTDGSLRDIYISNTTKEDWSKWINYVNENYYIEFYNGKTGKNEHKIDTDIVFEYWSGDSDLCSTAKIFIDNIQINAHFFAENEFENDISPKEFNQIEDHYKLIDYLTGLSKLFEREVLLTPENEYNFSLIKVSGNAIIYTHE